MSIERISAQNVSRAYVQQSADAAPSAGAQQPGKAGRHAHHAAAKADSVTLSDSARSLAAARQAVQDAPDVRHEKVAAIKQQVDTGTYSVPASVLARKMVDASKNPS